MDIDDFYFDEDQFDILSKINKRNATKTPKNNSNDFIDDNENEYDFNGAGFSKRSTRNKEVNYKEKYNDKFIIRDDYSDSSSDNNNISKRKNKNDNNFNKKENEKPKVKILNYKFFYFNFFYFSYLI